MALAIKEEELDELERWLRYLASLVRYDDRQEPKRALDEALKTLEKLKE